MRTSLIPVFKKCLSTAFPKEPVPPEPFDEAATGGVTERQIAHHADDARTRGGIPGYGRPVPRPAPEADRDPASRGGDAPSPSGSTRE